jgi:hypothetical protein
MTQGVGDSILVTGAHRSGTTWVGRMLAANSQVAYVSEPLNVWHRPGVLRTPVQHWYTYICTENEDKYFSSFQETLNLEYHTWLEVKSLRSLKDFMRMWRDWWVFSKGRWYSQIPLIKDPFALFSASWFAKRLNCRVVILVRHPAAITSSLMRLGWNFDFRDLLQQPLLMRDWLESFRGDMEGLLDSPEDVIAQSCLLWRMVYQVVSRLRDMYPEFLIIRHEDISMDPLGEFEKLYEAFDLEFSHSIKQTILNSSSGKNPREASRRAAHSVHLNSPANIKNWKYRLSKPEIDRVRELTSDIAPLFYSDQDWD